MNRFFTNISLVLAILLAPTACVMMDDDTAKDPSAKNMRMRFDISVTRDGKPLTRTDVDSGDKLATMNEDIPFGLVAIDFEKGQLVLDNAKVQHGGIEYSAAFDGYMWNGIDKVTLSAYYPYINNIDYGDGFENYVIDYSVKETEAGPLVSKTVERAINQLNMVPLVFQHITNDIGYKICDITPDKDLQGLIHLRKLTATNVASAGVFVNDILEGSGTWHKQGYYRKVVVFEGDALVGVGSENEKFVGWETLEDHMADSHRYYSIPDDIEVGKQCVEVIFDVDGFTHNGFYYEPLKDQVRKFMLYGLLPNNVFVYGKQYTFHIGLDLSSVYQQITFAPSVGDWETSIYENNDDF